MKEYTTKQMISLLKALDEAEDGNLLRSLLPLYGDSYPEKVKSAFILFKGAFCWYPHIKEVLYEIKYEDLPIYACTNDRVGTIAKWRLRHGI